MLPKERAVLSVVIPVYNEAENLKPLIEELAPILSKLGLDFEVILVDDGSTDAGATTARALAAQHDFLKVFHNQRNLGKTAAWLRGLQESQGEILCTLDGDLQNDPHDIERLLAKLNQGYDLVSGWRNQRQASFLLRRIPSLVGNALTRFCAQHQLHDQGCGIKVFRRTVLTRLPTFEGMHRFFSAIVERQKFRVAEISVNDRKRGAGSSKYGLSRMFRLPMDWVRMELFLRKLPQNLRTSTDPLPSFVWLGTATFFGLLLRLHQLGVDSLWFDELLSVQYSSYNFFDIPKGLAVGVHPPFYFLMLNVWRSIFGSSEVALRMPSVFFGTLAVPAIGLVAARLFDRRVGWIAAALLAFAPFHIHYSQEARGYAVFSFLWLWSMISYGRLLSRPSPKAMGHHFAVSLLLALTHVFGQLLVAIYSLHFLLFRNRLVSTSLNLKSWILLQLGIAVAFAPWLTHYLTQIHHDNASWIPFSEWSTIAYVFREYFMNNATALGFALGIVGLGAGLSFKCDSLQQKKFLNAAFWFVVPAAAAYIISHFKPIILPRTMMQTFLMLVVLVAFGLNQVVVRFGWWAAGPLLLVVLSFSLGLARTTVYQKPTRTQWREAVKFIDDHLVDGDAVVIYPGWVTKMPLSYYGKKKNYAVHFQYNDPRKAAVVDPQILTHGRIWTLIGPDVIRPPLDLFDGFFPGYKPQAEGKMFNDVGVKLFERKVP